MAAPSSAVTLERLGLLMVKEVRILNKEIITEKHKRHRPS
jgi:hypothetical protein